MPDSYWIVVAVFAAYLFWTAVFRTGRDHVRWAYRRLRPVEEPPPTAPAVVLGGPWYSISTVTLPERKLEKTAWLTKLEVGFRGVENREAAVTVRNVTAGLRRKDTGAEVEAPGFRVPAIAPGGREEIPKVETPHEFHDGLSEQNYKDAVQLWARFEDPERRCWDVTLDPATQEHEYRLVAGTAG